MVTNCLSSFSGRVITGTCPCRASIFSASNSLEKSEGVVARLTDDPSVVNTLVIVMTNTAAGADIARSSGIDPDAYVQKPFDPDEFLDIVREFESFALSFIRTSFSENARESPPCGHLSSELDNRTISILHSAAYSL